VEIVTVCLVTNVSVTAISSVVVTGRGGSGVVTFGGIIVNSTVSSMVSSVVVVIGVVV
jgi:hypothetical protein